MADPSGDVASCTDSQQKVLLEMAGKLKSHANDAVKKNDFSQALYMYEQARQALAGADNFDPEVAELELSLQRNLALVYLKLEQADDAINAATKIIDKVPLDTKALY